MDTTGERSKDKNSIPGAQKMRKKKKNKKKTKEKRGVKVLAHVSIH